MEKVSKILTSLATIGATALGLILLIVVIVSVIKVQTEPSDDNSSISISEAQEKCVLIEEAAIVNFTGEPLNSSTRETAEKDCLKQWDRSIDPDRTDEKFIERIETQWEEHKTDIMNGKTLEELYDESTK